MCTRQGLCWGEKPASPGPPHPEPQKLPLKNLTSCVSCIIFSLSLSLFFKAAPVAYGGSQAGGLIGAAATSLHHSLHLCQILAHGMRPGVEPALSWILVGFITAEPQWELLFGGFHCPGQERKCSTDQDGNSGFLLQIQCLGILSQALQVWFSCPQARPTLGGSWEPHRWAQP